MRTPRTQLAAAMLASALPGDIPVRRRIVARAEPHGVAAALKAEAPLGQSYTKRAKAACAARSGIDGGDPEEWEDVAGYIDPDGWIRINQRAARKVRMAAKRRRGWM